MKRWGSSAFKFDNFSTTERRFMHLKAFKCHDDFCGKEVSVTIIQLKCKVESKPDQDEFCFSLSLELPGIVFTVLVRCPHAALDLTGDTKDHRDTLLDYEVRGYSAIVLFGSNLCRLAPADGC